MRLSLLALITATAFAGCGTPTPSVPPPPGSPLAPLAGAASQIDLRSQEARPKLAIIRREGDPAPAAVIAVAPDAGPAAHAALAGMLKRRLDAAGIDADLHSDGVGVRAVAQPSEDVEALLEAWMEAARAPVTKADVVAANERMAQLSAAPLPSPALTPVARCAGDGRALATDLEPIDQAGLDGLRRGTLVMERTSVAVVGDAEVGEAASEAMEDAEGWMRGTPAAFRMRSKHGAFVSTRLAPAAARLHVAVHLGDAVDAVGAAHRLRNGPPLSTKLDALSSPWRVSEITAVALPIGGCVSVVLEPRHADARQLSELGSSAARALSAVERELALQGAIETDPFLVTREIIGAGSARDAASRAAWWALSAPRDEPTVASSALEVGAPGKEPITTGDGKELEESAVDARYVSEVKRVPAPPKRIAALRQRTEKGQGQFWLLVASPCPMLHEGQWDAGMAALAATTASAQSHDPAVKIEPWITADGVGIIAHGAAVSGGEGPVALAERVAAAAGQAYAAVPFDVDAFARGKRVSLQHTGHELGGAFFSLSRRVLPDHPSWMSPYGSASRVAALTLPDVAARWREILHAPVRVAVINNRDAAQAEAARRVVDHWLLPEARERPCTEAVSHDAPQVGSYAIRTAQPTVMVAVPYLGLGERLLAELTGAALGHEDDPIHADGRPWEVRVVGGITGGAVVLTARVSGQDVQPAVDAAVARLDALVKKGPDEQATQRARDGLAASRKRMRAAPRARLVDVWLGRDPSAPPELPDAAAWRKWLQKRAKRPVIVKSK